MNQRNRDILFFLVLTITALWLGAINTSYASVSKERAMSIFRQIAPPGITLSFKNSGVVQAESYGRHVTIYEGMLQFVDNDSQLALVIGHELGHIANGDGQTGTPTFAMEYGADLYGFKLAKAKGYNACRGLKLFLKFSKLPKNIVWSYAHPKALDRYKALAKYCK